MKKRLLISIVSIFTVLSAAWWFSPEQVIKRRSISLFEILTIDLSKPPTTRALAVYSLHPYLATEVEVSTPTPEEANGTFAREELESAFSSICQHALQCAVLGRHGAHAFLQRAQAGAQSSLCRRRVLVHSVLLHLLEAHHGGVVRALQVGKALALHVQVFAHLQRKHHAAGGCEHRLPSQ